jgi:hypothetical protein
MSAKHRRHAPATKAYRDGELCAHRVWHDNWVVVQPSWHELEVLGSPPPASGAKQVLWQFAAEELHVIMQVVTVDVTVVVSGVIAVVCAKAAPAAKMPDKTAAETATTIAMRRIIASGIAVTRLSPLATAGTS